MKNKPKVHFIGIGAKIMHSLAIALKNKGYEVSGSDEVIYGPSKTNLTDHGLLPKHTGWAPSLITSDLDSAIIGVHVSKDNPELKAALASGVKVYSYPEFIYNQCKDKQRIVISGSHGKTTITSMILHVLKSNNKAFDYFIGDEVPGFENLIKLTDDAPMVILEGDEYLSSQLDMRPKFLNFKHHIGLVSSIAWEHVNAYPTFDDYVKQFDLFADSTPKAGALIYCENDDMATVICGKEREDVVAIPYNTHKYTIKKGETWLSTEIGEIPVKIIGEHNLRNLNGAKAVCSRIGISKEKFYEVMSSYQTPYNRLEIIAKNEDTTVFKDFAHSPAKLRATVKAVKNQFPNKKILACMELDIQYNWNQEFLNQFANTFKTADEPVVFIKAGTSEFTDEQIIKAFNEPALKVFSDKTQLESYFKQVDWQNKNLLLMSSSNFDGIDLNELSKKILKK